MANTLEELVVKISADNKDLVAALQESAKTTQNAAQQMSKSIEDFSASGTQGTSNFQTAFSTMIGFIGGEAIIEAFKKAAEAAKEFFEDTIGKGVEAAIATEDAIERLDNALAMSGQYSQKASKDLQDFAQHMQETTKFGDDAVLSAGALIESLGRLDEQGLKKATTAAADLSVALGVDLNTAAMLVAKAAAGHVETFQRYGIAVQEGSTRAETFANALNVINQKFGGSAAAQVSTFSGQVALLGHNYEDATKQIGFAITQNQAVLNVITQVNKVVSEFGAELEKDNISIKKFVGEGLSDFLATATFAVVMTDELIRVFQTLYGAAQAITIPLGLVTLAVRSATVGFSQASAEFNEFAESARKNITALGSEGDGKLADLATRLLQLKNAADEGLGEIGRQADDVPKHINSTNKGMEELTVKMKKLVDIGKEVGQALLDSVTVPDQIYAREKQKLDDDYKDKLKGTGTYFKDLRKLEDDKDKGDLKALDALHKAQQISDSDYAKAKQALAQQTKDREVQLAREERDAKLAVLAAEANAVGQTGQNIMTLAAGSNRELFEIGKRSAEASALVSTYAGAAKALEQGGFFGIAMAAAVITQGMVQVANIEAQHFAQGGTVPGVGFSDSIPSMLTPGEEVVDRSTSQMLRDFLSANSRNPSSPRTPTGSISIELSLKDELVEFIEAKILQRQASNISLLPRMVS